MEKKKQHQGRIKSRVYITQDYTRIIKKELASLIKAMMRSRSLGMRDIKVIARHLVIGKERYDYKNIPVDLKEGH